VEGGDSIEEHERALLRVHEHGLDVNRVVVVEAFEVRYFSCPAFEVLFFTASTADIN